MIYQISSDVYSSYSRLSVFIALFLAFVNHSFSQNVVINSTPNTACNGLPCDWQGPSIMINEIMISPTVGDGSLVGPGPGGGRGEWIELYNPDVCNPVDISCYYLGNNTFEGSGGFRLPNNLIVPPAGFVILRGVDAAPVPASSLVANGGNVIEVVAPMEIDGTGVCVVGPVGTRLWFPNSGGWFAFYNANGVPQDAISWGAPDPADPAGVPCIPNRPGCGASSVLSSYNNIPTSNKFYGSPANANNHVGQSIRRIPDGGPWAGVGTPTFANCNAPCFTPGTSTCTGTATVSSAQGNPPYTYSWNDPDNQTSQTATGLCPGNYIVTVTSSNGVISTGTVTIVDFVPPVTFNMNATLCVNSPSIQFTGYTPVPTPNQQGVFTGPGTTQNTFNPATAGVGVHNITYTFTNQSGCTNNAQATLTVLPLPILNINAPSSICVNTAPITINLAPSGGLLSGPGVSGNTFNPSVAGVGTHILTYAYTDANACSNTTTHQIVVNPIPSLTINSLNALCIDANPVTLSGTPSNGIFTFQGNPIATFDPGAFGVGTHILNYAATDNNGCSNQQNFTITVNPLPTVNFQINDELCLNSLFYPFTDYSVSPAGGNIVFTGPGVVNNGILALNAGIGLHNIVLDYTDLNGCQSSTNANVMVFGNPETSMTGNNGQYCVTDSITDFEFFPSGGILYGPATQNNQFFPNQTIPGIYNLWYVYIDQNGCTDTLNFNVEVIPLPVLEIFTEPIICINAPAFLIPTSPSNVGNIEIDGVPGNSIDPNQLGEGVHEIFFEYTDDVGCYNNTSKLLYIAPIPDISLDLDPIEACPPVNYLFLGTTTNGVSCVWDFGDSTDFLGCGPVGHSYYMSGCYSPRLTVTSEYGCVNDTLLFNHICINPKPLASFIFAPTALTILQSTTRFINNSLGANSYNWNFNVNGINYTSTEENPQFTFPPGTVGQYPVTLHAISNLGCIDSTTIVIRIEGDVILYVPNTFTPDSDKFNQFWEIETEGIDLSTFHLLVYNRWGEIVWESYNAAVGWDGTYGGKIVQDGTYVWTITAKHLFKDKRQTWTGHVNVLR